ncbi:MAG: sulfite exporter TauE/SafE family protein [Desulfobacterales bacterium]|nr:sulfite exporter TauE/SafE family protein [Desulfobacterales bacterium]
MMNLVISCALIFIVAVTMTMVGKGGGNFYVVILAIGGLPMHQAATTGQFILFAASVAAMIVFQKNKAVSWPLALLVGGLTAAAALAGGYFSHLFSGFALKIIFAVMLAAAGGVMLLPVSENKHPERTPRFGTLRLKSGEDRYFVNLWIAVPATILTGIGSGMVGVSGGSFLVPLMVVACGVSMHKAVGTSSTLIAAIAFMGFTGHAVQGDFNPQWALPLAAMTVIGGILGGKFALNTKPKYLKQVFAYTNWLAALFMVINAFYTTGGV